MSGEDEENLPLLLRQYELSENLEDSSLRRRHIEEEEEVEEKKTEEVSAKERRKQRRREREKRREEKKKKRDKEKRRRRKQNKRFKSVLDNEDVLIHNVDGEEYLDCCPSKLVVVEKRVGKDRDNHAVEVRPSQKYFYERVCLPDIEDRECVFPARSLKNGVVTRCAQQFSYVQAQVRPYLSDTDWQLDYIHVRSGCSCQVNITSKAKKKLSRN